MDNELSSLINKSLERAKNPEIYLKSVTDESLMLKVFCQELRDNNYTLSVF